MNRLSIRASSSLIVASCAAALFISHPAAAQLGTNPDGTPTQPPPPTPPAAPPPGPAAPAAAPGAQPPAGAPADTTAPAPLTEGPGAEGASGSETAGATTPEATAQGEWAQRDELINESSTITGGIGLLRTQHAVGGEPGQFRLGFVGEWFTAGFLCTTNGNFSCPNPAGGSGRVTGDTLNHVGATIAVDASLFKIGTGTFDAYISTEAMANSDNANVPTVLQVLGDTNFSVKYAAPVADVLSLGLMTELWLINGTGSVGLDASGTSAKFGGLATLDLRPLESHPPVRFSLNTVYTLDNTGAVVSSAEQERGHPITRVERYGLGVNRVDHFDLLFGAEFFAAEERVRPFLETKVVIPTNRQGYQCHIDNPSNDHCMANDVVVPATLTLGSRFFPWKRGFSLLAAVDIGLSGTSDFVEELAPVPPWTIFLGAGWSVDTWERPPVVKTQLVEKPETAPPRARVVGFVHEKDTNNPVAGAIVSFRGAPNMWPLATGADGRFGEELAPGQYTFDIKADGYKPGACTADVPRVPQDVNIDCPVEALPRFGAVVGHVRDAETNQPLGGIPLVLSDSQRKELRLTSDASGAFKFETVPPGPAELNVVADGYLVLVAPTDVRPRQDTNVDLMLRPKPKQSNVSVTPTEITIKQQIQFALDSAVILPESFGLLTEIADTIIRHPEITRVEVQGHTDNSGSPDHNMVLSEQRAEAVRAWLVQHGVQADRLVAKGYGQDKPLVPNVTPQMRARNRRVQFIILEKNGAAAASPPAPGPATGAVPPGGAPAQPQQPPPRQKTPLPGF